MMDGLLELLDDGFPHFHLDGQAALRWESPDGSQVMTEYLPLGYSIGMQLRFRQDPAELAEALRDAVTWLDPMSARDRFLVTAGSDHHGPDPTLPSRLSDAEKFAPELDARVGSIAEQLELPVTDDVPVWRGGVRSAARGRPLPGGDSALGARAGA